MKSIYMYMYIKMRISTACNKYRNCESQYILQTKHTCTCRCKNIICTIGCLNHGWIWVKESYLHIPQPEIRTIVRAAGNNVSAIWAPGNVGHPIGMVLKSLLNSQLICWLKYKSTCLQFCACFSGNKLQLRIRLQPKNYR